MFVAKGSTPASQSTSSSGWATTTRASRDAERATGGTIHRGFRGLRVPIGASIGTTVMRGSGPALRRRNDPLTGSPGLTGPPGLTVPPGNGPVSTQFTVERLGREGAGVGTRGVTGEFAKDGAVADVVEVDSD